MNAKYSTSKHYVELLGLDYAIYSKWLMVCMFAGRRSRYQGGMKPEAMLNIDRPYASPCRRQQEQEEENARLRTDRFYRDSGEVASPATGHFEGWSSWSSDGFHQLSL